MPKNSYPIKGSRIGGTGTPGSKLLKKVSGTAIAKGDVVTKGTGGDVDKVLLAGTTAAGPFKVAIEAAAATDTTVSCVDDGEVLLQCDGAIEVGALVMRSGTTAGRVVTFSGTDESLIIGQYLRHEGEDAADQTAAADGDIIVVRLHPPQRNPA